jgi:cytochrome b involved in lipid metabolism
MSGTIRQRASEPSKPKDRTHITKKVASEYDNEVLINGRWYDITAFEKRHPGGSIIKWYKGKNASEAYAEFHNRSKKADKFLSSIPSRADEGKSQLDGNLDPLTKDFNELRQQL